ncbi:MAG: hypothetical protein ACYC0V_08810, partial [Armatimonadota bacterium]
EKETQILRSYGINMEMKIGACSKIVLLFNTWWTLIGWSCFVGSILFLYFPGGIPFALISFLLFLSWWVIDAIDQSVPVWQFAVGIAMLIVAFLPRGGTLYIAAWMIYWFKIRE